MAFDTSTFDVVTLFVLIIGTYYVWSSKRVTGEKGHAVTLAKLTSLEEQLKKREDDLQEQELALKKRIQEIDEHEADLKRRIEVIEQKETASTNSDAEAEPQISSAATETVTLTTEPKTSVNSIKPELDTSTEEIETVTSSPKNCEGEKRKKWIEEELARLVKEAEETELEEPFDEDSLEALKKAAFKICYLKKYYDVMKDDLIYFPSVTKTLVNYSLLEEAEKFYFEEEDEYPQDLAIGLRSVATAALAGSDDDTDEDYIAKLALDVEI